jgi:capsular exopolysaccharide synthesis family protein
MNAVENKPISFPNHGTFPSTGGESQLMRTSVFAGSPPFLGPPPVARGESAGAGSPSTGAILQALRRRWPVALGAGVLAGTLGVLAVLVLFPAPYTANGIVLIKTRPDPKMIGIQDNNNEDPTIFKGTMTARVKSPMVLMAALKDQDFSILRGNPNPVKWLETAVKTDFLLGPEILRITLSGDDPQDVAGIINRITDAFIEENRQDEEKRFRKNMEILEVNRQKAEDENRRKKTQLAKEEQDRQIPNEAAVNALFQAAQNQVDLLKKENLQAYLELIQAKNEYASLEEKEKLIGKSPAYDGYVDNELAKSAEGKYLLDRRKEIEDSNRLSQIKNIAGLKQVTDQIDELRKIYVKNAIGFEKEKVTDRINNAAKKKEILDNELSKAQEEVRRWNPLTRRLPPSIEALRDEVARSDAVLTELGKTIAVLKVEPPPGARVKEWNRAEPPAGKDYSRQIKFGGAAGFGLFMLAVLGVGFLELRSGRISSTDEVLGMPVVGTIPPVPAKARSLTANGEASIWQSKLMEAVDSIRTFLIHAARTDNVRVVMVTSAGIGEGKTSLASQLAASLARSWRKTLLIDGDMRHPATHTLFNVPLEPGFAEVLRGEASLAEAVKPTALSRLWLMPAGHCDAHAVQALAQDNVGTMIDTLKQQYDFIIVDSCPVLPVADSLSLGQHVDAVLYAVLRDVSRVPALKAAQMRLANLDIRTLGAVLIGTSMDTGNSGSRYAMLEGSLK